MARRTLRPAERRLERSVINLVRTSANARDRADFFERGAGYREKGVTIGADRAEMRIAESAGRGFAAAAEWAGVHGGPCRIASIDRPATPLFLALRRSRPTS